MDKVDRLIAIVRQLKEEMGGMTTGSSGPIAGFSSAAERPVAGYDKVMPPPKKQILGKGKLPGARKRWMQSLDTNK